MVHLFLPLFAAIIYTIASLFFKQGYLRGATAAQTFHVSNMIGGLIFLPLWIFGGHIPFADLWHPALVAGLILFAGFTMFLSIRFGDISLVTPLMGTKVIFVALAQVIITGEALSTGLWIASLLTMFGILLIGYKDLKNSRAGLAGILLAILSSLSFRVSDVFMQQWAPLYGKVAFLGAVAGIVGLFSVVKLSMSRLGVMNFVPGAFRPVALASIILAGQGMMMGYALGFFHDAARVNVVYGSRGLWSLVLVFLIGRFFGNDERHSSGGAFLWRVAGTILITTAIVIAFMGK